MMLTGLGASDTDRRRAVTLNLLVERDSVCMGDDADAPHTLELPLPPASSALDAVTAALAQGILPAVAGGSTWIVYADGRPVAVATRDRHGSAPLLALDAPSGPAPALLFFAYYLANDPSRLIADLVAGRTPERRSGSPLRD